MRLTMLARYAMGRQGEALDAYRQCRAALAKDLGLEPTPETKGLEAAMLRQEALEALLPARVIEQGGGPGPVGKPSLDGLGLDLDNELGDLVEVALAGACALAHVGGGEQAVLRLLEEASRLREALAGNGDRVRALELLRGLILRGRGAWGWRASRAGCRSRSRHRARAVESSPGHRLGKRRGDLQSARDVELQRLAITGPVPADGSLTVELIALYRRIGMHDAGGVALWARRHDVA